MQPRATGRLTVFLAINNSQAPLQEKSVMKQINTGWTVFTVQWSLFLYQASQLYIISSKSAASLKQVLTSLLPSTEKLCTVRICYYTKVQIEVKEIICFNIWNSIVQKMCICPLHFSDYIFSGISCIDVYGFLHQER